jgi:hypothetical protein
MAWILFNSKSVLLLIFEELTKQRNKKEKKINIKEINVIHPIEVCEYINNIMK